MKYQYNLFTKSSNNCCKNRAKSEQNLYRINNFTSLLCQYMYVRATTPCLNGKTRICVFINNVQCETEDNAEAQGRNCVVNRWSYSSIPCVGERVECLSITLFCPYPLGYHSKGLEFLPLLPTAYLVLIGGSRLYAFLRLPLLLHHGFRQSYCKTDKRC